MRPRCTTRRRPSSRASLPPCRCLSGTAWPCAAHRPAGHAVSAECSRVRGTCSPHRLRGHGGGSSSTASVGSRQRTGRGWASIAAADMAHGRQGRSHGRQPQRSSAAAGGSGERGERGERQRGSTGGWGQGGRAVLSQVLSLCGGGPGGRVSWRLLQGAHAGGQPRPAARHPGPEHGQARVGCPPHTPAPSSARPAP